MSTKTKQDLIDSATAVLQSENTRLQKTLVDYWHERAASGCWVKPKWDVIAKVVVEDVLFELGMEDDIR